MSRARALRRALLPAAALLALALPPHAARAMPIAFDIEGVLDISPDAKVSLSVVLPTIQAGKHITDTFPIGDGFGVEVESTLYEFDSTSLALTGAPFEELDGALLGGAGGVIEQRDGLPAAFGRPVVPDLFGFTARFDTGISGTGVISMTVSISDPTLALIAPTLVISRTIGGVGTFTDTISALITDPELFAASEKRFFLDLGRGGGLISGTITAIASRAVGTAIPEPRTPFILMLGLALLGLLAHVKRRLERRGALGE